MTYLPANNLLKTRLPVRRSNLGRAALAFVFSSIATFGAATDNAESGADTLGLSEMTLSFSEDFDTLDVSAWGPGTRWIAHTPWSGDFGGARFADPREGFPFTVDEGVLQIEAARDAEDEWHSGLIASVDPHGDGFSQQYGYFEMRARLPTGPGVWPAFWLIGKDRSKSTAEIDIIEFYGDKPEGYSSVVHVWHRDGQHYSRYNRHPAFSTETPDDFNTYGVKIDQDWIRFYFNRKFVWKTETQEEHRQPLYMLVNLALVDGPTKEDVPDPSFMYVDYVRAYRLD